MIFRNSILAIALWTLLLAPLFCGLGVVVHACFDEHATKCHHELECEADPCQVLLLAKSQRTEEYSASNDQPDPCELPLLLNNTDPSHPVPCQPSPDPLFEPVGTPLHLPLLC